MKKKTVRPLRGDIRERIYETFFTDRRTVVPGYPENDVVRRFWEVLTLNTNSTVRAVRNVFGTAPSGKHAQLAVTKERLINRESLEFLKALEIIRRRKSHLPAEQQYATTDELKPFLSTTATAMRRHQRLYLIGAVKQFRNSGIHRDPRKGHVGDYAIMPYGQRLLFVHSSGPEHVLTVNNTVVAAIGSFVDAIDVLNSSNQFDIRKLAPGNAKLTEMCSSCGQIESTHEIPLGKNTGSELLCAKCANKAIKERKLFDWQGLDPHINPGTSVPELTPQMRRLYTGLGMDSVEAPYTDEVFVEHDQVVPTPDEIHYVITGTWPKKGKP